MEIFKPTLNFDFNKITLGNPQPIQGGSFFSKITFSPEEKDLYIQLPKCITKQAIIGTKRGKYCDLMYTRDHNEHFFNWLEKLETVFHDLIDKKKNLWFTGEYTKDDIENMMAPITRIYKSGAYTLLRTYIHTNKHTGEDKCSAYNESEINIDINSIVPENDIIPLILIDGVKFTSRSFELDIKLTQFMVLSESINLNKKCLIQVSNKIKENSPQPLEFAHTVDAHTVDAHVVDAHVVADAPANTNALVAPALVADALTVALATNTNAPANALVAPANTNTNALVAIVQPNANEPEEVDLDKINIEHLETIKLKKPNEVYYDIYRAAREKAKNMRKLAIQAYLEAKEIKTKYILDDIDISEDEFEE